MNYLKNFYIRLSIALCDDIQILLKKWESESILG